MRRLRGQSSGRDPKRSHVTGSFRQTIRDRSNPIVWRYRYSEACEALADDLIGAPQSEQYPARVNKRGYAIAAHLSHTRTRPIFKARISVNVMPAVTRSRVVPGSCQTVHRPSGPAANAIIRYRISLVFALRIKVSPVVAQTLNSTHTATRIVRFTGVCVATKELLLPNYELGDRKRSEESRSTSVAYRRQRTAASGPPRS